MRRKNNDRLIWLAAPGIALVAASTVLMNITGSFMPGALLFVPGMILATVGGIFFQKLIWRKIAGE